MTSYRQALRMLDAGATPAPWVAQGEFYGVIRDGGFRPIGFAPHHADDPVIIAAYRNALGRLLDVTDSAERHLRRALADESFPTVPGMMELLETLDDQELDGEPLTVSLARLDRVTTQPLWDAGHLAMGMDILEHLAGVERWAPSVSDPGFIAATRSAVPRILSFLTTIGSAVVADGHANGLLDPAIVNPLLARIEGFDRHDVNEGAGTSTV